MSDNRPVFIPHPELQDATIRVKAPGALQGICGRVIGCDRFANYLLRASVSASVLAHRQIILLGLGGTIVVNINDIEIVCSSVLDKQHAEAMRAVGFVDVKTSFAL